MSRLVKRAENLHLAFVVENFQEFKLMVRKLANVGLRNFMHSSTLKRKKMKNYFFPYVMNALYEIAVISHRNLESHYLDKLIEYGIWMIDDNELLQKKINTASLVQGLIPAYESSCAQGNVPLAEDIFCALHQSMEKNLLPLLLINDDGAAVGFQNIADDGLISLETNMWSVMAFLQLRKNLKYMEDSHSKSPCHNFIKEMILPKALGEIE